MAKEKSSRTPASDTGAGIPLRASSKALPLPPGLFRFTVTAAKPVKVEKAGSLEFPALHVAPGPGCKPSLVEFIGMPKSIGTWLYHPGDTLVVKVEEPGATLLLSSVRSEGTEPLEVDVNRLDGRAPATSKLQAAQLPSGLQAGVTESLKLQLGLHIRTRGDQNFAGGTWAGALADNLWVEALSIKMLETLTSRDVEYKGLSANGFETPWLTDGATCGTKGVTLPLIGFAIRLKADAAAHYDCEYSGYFQSGATVGPVRNGVPCRSKVATDPLVGVRLSIVKRGGAKAVVPTEAKTTAAKGPKFSKFGEAIKAAARVGDKKTPPKRK
jgi:hypothetical protein